jgi:hypothetical protein
MFGVGPDDWAIVDGDRLAAKLVRLRREEAKAGRINLRTCNSLGDLPEERSGGKPLTGIGHI